MTLIPRIKPAGFLFCAGMASALALAGCNRDQIKVQEVPKDSGPSAQAPMMDQVAAQSAPANPHAGMDMNPHAGMDMGAASQPKLGYVLPSGWKAKDLQQMRVGSFDAPGKNGEVADVSIIPLPLMPPETDLPNLNMWRSSIGLPAADKVESQPVVIGSAQGKLYEIGGDKATGRIIVAELDRDGMSWYFKIMGSDAVVREQKPAFLDFVKSIRFESAPATAAAATPSAMDAPAGATLSSAGVAVPAGWTEIPNPQMLLAKYVIHGNGGAEAEVNVSMLAGTGGGLMANINRWRGQLSLPPVSEEDFSKTAGTVVLPNGNGTVVDMTGTNKSGKKSRLIGIIVPQANDTWFYKLMGDEQIVEQQKDAFTKFIQSAKFSDAL